MLKKSIFVLSVIANGFLTIGCASASRTTGPGMIVHFGNSKTEILLVFEKIVTSTGSDFVSPGGLGPVVDPMHNGKTMGATGDQRELPEWVEFTWREHPNIEPKRTREEYMARPLQTKRVQVRSRIPQSVVDEIVKSKQDPVRNKKEDLSLWVHFIWTDDGIKFIWREKSGCCEIVRFGGDELKQSH